MTSRRHRICILSGNHLCHNPRVIKEATALARGGHEVEVLGGWVDSSLKSRDQELNSTSPFRFTPVVDFTHERLGAQAKAFASRLASKVGMVGHRYGGVSSRWQLGLKGVALAQAGRARAADLYIAHSETSLVAVERLRRVGHRIGVDMEDWFSEDLLPEARRSRPVRILRDLEEAAIRSGAFASCPSHTMSEALADAYRCVPPIVIYNAFPWADRQDIDGADADRKSRELPSIHWYSQTLGLGRGLEDLIAALPMVRTDAEIHLRGHLAAGFERWLSEHLPPRWRARTFLHELVPNDRLLSRIAEHDIGFAGEMKYCRSRDLTVTNKILHYLLGGLAIVASDTAGQAEVAGQAPGAVLLYPSGNAGALADRLDLILSSPERMRAAKAAALVAAERTFCWERQEGRLLDGVARALESALANAVSR